MSLFANLRSEFLDAIEHLGQKVSRAQTASEKVVQQKLAQLHDILVGVEAKFVVLESDVVKEARAIVADVKGVEHSVVAKFDAALKTAEAAEARLAAALKQQQQQQSAVVPAPAQVVIPPAAAAAAAGAPVSAPAPVDNPVDANPALTSTTSS